jgi:hypothetical protein
MAEEDLSQTRISPLRPSVGVVPRGNITRPTRIPISPQTGRNQHPWDRKSPWPFHPGVATEQKSVLLLSCNFSPAATYWLRGRHFWHDWLHRGPAPFAPFFALVSPRPASWFQSPRRRSLEDLDKDWVMHIISGSRTADAPLGAAFRCRSLCALFRRRT